MQPLVGRTKEVARASALLEEVAASGRGGLLFFTGEPGIGKSRLAQSVEVEGRRRGFRIAWGRCWEVGSAPAFWPWMQIFDALAIADPFAGRATASDSEDRFRQLDRAARLLVEAAHGSPVLLVLDDLHAADLPSLELLLILARRLRLTRILVVGSYRDAEARLGASGTLLAKIAREGQVLPLARLEEGHVTEWIRATTPDATSEQGAEVHRITEGNPLFVHELLRIGRLKSIDARRLPDGLTALLDEHLALVPTETRDTLAVATILGREIAIDDVVALTDDGRDAVEAAFRRATAAGLLEPVMGSTDRWALSHILLRDRLYADLPATRRAELHWKAGEHLLASSKIAGAAYHLLEGVRAGDRLRAAGVAKEAAIIATARFAFEEAASLASRALDALGPEAEGALVCELEILRAEANVRTAAPRAKEDCIRAARLARKVGSPSLEARAALAYGAELTNAKSDGVMVSLLSDALASLESRGVADTLRARVLVRLAAALTPPTPERHEDVLRMAREGVALARRLRDADALVYATRFAMIALGYHVERGEYYGIVEEVIALAKEHDRPLVLLDAAGWSVCTLREQGHRADAIRSLEVYASLATEFPRPHHRCRVPLLRATGAILDGDFEVAEWLGREALAIAEQLDLSIDLLGWAQHRVALAIARGEPKRIAPDAERILAMFDRSPRLWAFTAWILAATDRTEEARALLGQHPLGPTEYPMMLVAAEAVVLMRDEVLAKRYFEALSALPNHLVMFWGGPAGTTAIGPYPRELAELLLVLGRHEEASAMFDEAIAAAERLQAKPFLELARKGRACVHAPRPSSKAATGNALVALTRSGEAWTLDYGGRTHVLKARRGLEYLATLLDAPGREMHVLDLSSSVAAPGGDRGAPLLDRAAKDAYRSRLEDLRDAAERAREMGDADRADEAQAEIDALAAELARALGLGGRDRTTATAAERARAAVTLALRRAIDAVKELEPVLGGHLESAVKTGSFCVYRPDPHAGLVWKITAVTT